MILIAGGGIAGLVMGLTLHQLGLPFRVYERVAEPRPLGVGDQPATKLGAGVV